MEGNALGELVQRLQDKLARLFASIMESWGYDVEISRRVNCEIESTAVVILVAAVVMVAAVVLIIHQLRKPRFARLAISVKEEPSMYETSRQELPNTKAPVNAMKLGVSGENCGVSNAQLLNVLLKPARASKAIDVVCKKIEADYEITMGEKPLKAGQKVRWQMEGELRIRRMNEDSALVLKLCENQENNGMADFMDIAGGADDWTSDIHDFENTASKKSKRVSRSARKNTKQDTHEKILMTGTMMVEMTGMLFK